MAGLILRRILWMVPTLVIISILSFTIIQLPPGDYLTSYVTALEAVGDNVSMEAVENLRKAYHLDEPAWKRYIYWMKGLVVGDMGQSMEWQQPVSKLIGERLALTIVISIFTLFFTWALAIPIGIYSAVRQYSLLDYCFTFIGFIGIATPGFLLALVFMFASYKFLGVSPGGLFSPAHEGTNWFLNGGFNWAKTLDLMKHIWIPVIMIGVSGTASLIRIMRANLLDELRKQYVMTARAKGVGPVKLLFKYPVRVALNPIISTVGWLLPTIVSGSVIVAVVLNLHTVGPLLLGALLSQDMYLAGSMIMMLSTLTVIGTLLSDLLLLWVDPRIRYDKAGL